MAEKVISAYEESRSKSHNLIVLGHFRLNETESYVAAVGPLSTRAPVRAREVGERFAWDYKTRKGTGRYVVVPLIRNPAEAWDEARKTEISERVQTLLSVVPGVEASYEPMRFELTEAQRAGITADWQVDAETIRRYFGPACICGLSADLVCPRHPEGREA